MSIGFAFMAWAFGEVSYTFRSDKPLWRSKRWNLATGLAVLSCVLMLVSTVRAYDVWTGTNVSGSDPLLFGGLLLLAFMGVVQVVWSVSLPDTAEMPTRKLWYAFVGCEVLWWLVTMM